MRVICIRCVRGRTHVQNVVSVYVFDVVLDAPGHRAFFILHHFLYLPIFLSSRPFFVYDGESHMIQTRDFVVLMGLLTHY